MTGVIHTEGLGKVYRSGFLRLPFTGLEGLSLTVPAGTAFGFVGPNGAGKTTAIKILMGIQRQTSGRAFIHGLPIEDPLCRRRVGFVPERPYFYEHLTAAEFLDFYGRLCEVPVPERSRRATRLLERVNLARFANVQLGSFSKGMLQRAGLAQALMGDPDLLVLDEPMSGLDPLGRVLVRDIILEERREGKTVFFSSHILSDIEAICDRVAILVLGKLRGQGTLPELIGQSVQLVDCIFEIGVDLPGPWLREGSRLRAQVPPDDVGPLIDRVRAAGGSVTSIVPQVRSLEDLLLSEVERAAPADARRLGVLA